MTLTLYNLHSDGSRYRITKFIGGEPEASYQVSHSECSCPAGSRPTCRHRQMLPELLRRNLLNSFLFWDFDRKQSCDMNGHVQRATIEVQPATPQRAIESTPATSTPHSVVVNTEDFESSIGGSSPPAATKPANWRRL